MDAILGRILPVVGGKSPTMLFVAIATVLLLTSCGNTGSVVSDACVFGTDTFGNCTFGP